MKIIKQELQFEESLKQRFDEPKEQLEQEIKIQNSKLERIKNAYINSVFELEEYKSQKLLVEKTLKNLESELGNKNNEI